MVESELLFRPRLPRPAELSPHPVLIYDQILARKVPGFREWAERFSIRFPVQAGEELKSLESFSDFIRKLVDQTAPLPLGSLSIIAAGGGSVGDFAGFVASVFKRGVDLVHIPSTWLSALDSAHGGKTALNVGGAKNQIGTFYPASRIVLVRQLLLSQPEARTVEAYGELAKIALIDGKPWVKKLMQSRSTGGELIWKFLPEAIESKYRVVRRDPYEKRRIRQILNLGHTLGHVIEAYRGLSHGEAVSQGLLFAIEWSARRGHLKELEKRRVLEWLERQFGMRSRVGELGGIPKKETLALLTRDKKRDRSGSVLFVLLDRIGKTRIESVSLDELVEEACRQGWAAHSGGSS